MVQATGRAVEPQMNRQAISPSRGVWLAWLLALLTLVAVTLDFVIRPPSDAPGAVDTLVSALLLLIFPAMGVLIVSRRPRNVIGWLLCGVATLSATGSLSLNYAVQTQTVERQLPSLGVAAALYGGVARALGWYYMLTLTPLYFPNGRLVSARWRWALWIIAVATLAIALGVASAPFGDYTDVRLAGIHNPIGFLPAPVGGRIAVLGTMLFFIASLVSAVSVIARFRRARGIERQQLKWFVYTMAIGGCGGFLVILISMFTSPAGIPIGSVFYLVTVGMPISAGVAILRHRLYDIDIVIKRTLVYGSLTAILAALYFGVVIGAQRLTGLVTGKQGGQQTLVIVLTTLLISALVQPLRSWLQRGIDRRFYRSRYDASKTITTFSAALRSEVDLNQLTEHLLYVVDDTMHPAQVSLWLTSAHSGATLRQ